MLDNSPLQNLRNLIWFQRDGASLHNSIVVREYLNGVFLNTWIGRNDPIQWPARRPDLSVLVFLLRGSVNDIIYCNHDQTIEELQESVIEAFANEDKRHIRKALYSIQKKM